MISISPKKTIRFFAIAILCLCFADIAVQYIKYFTGHGELWGITRLFDLDEENNIPSWYSSMTLLLCSALLGLIFGVKQQRGDRYSNHWKGLSFIFLYMSIDEAASIHELLINLRTQLHSTDFLYFPWVIFGISAAVIVAIIYWKFLFSLPAKTRWLFISAGIIYVTGAAGVEMIGGHFLTTTEINTQAASAWSRMGYQMLLALEETLEMVGVGVFLYALLRYIAVEIRDIQIHVTDRKLSVLLNHSQRGASREMPDEPRSVP